MRIFIMKKKDTIIIYKESLLASILSDMLSALVMCLLIGLDIVFSIYVTHSWVIDVTVVLLLFLYIMAVANKKTHIKSKQEFKEIMEDFMNNEIK